MDENEEIDRLARLAEEMAEVEADMREVAFEQSLRIDYPCGMQV